MIGFCRQFLISGIKRFFRLRWGTFSFWPVSVLSFDEVLLTTFSLLKITVYVIFVYVSQHPHSFLMHWDFPHCKQNFISLKAQKNIEWFGPLLFNQKNLVSNLQTIIFSAINYESWWFICALISANYWMRQKVAIWFGKKRRCAVSFQSAYFNNN